jgi:hypothetical protein
MTAIPFTSKLTAKQTIHQLAKQHGINHQHTEFDDWCDKISELSDSDVKLDETQLLLVELGRAGILTGKDNTLLHGQYLQERDV